MFNTSQFNDALFNGQAGFVPVLPEYSFHAALADHLYRNLINRERRVLFGMNAAVELLTVSPAGEESLMVLTDNWTARRIPTIESASAEEWRLEIEGEPGDWNTLKNATRVRLRGATDEEQIYEVLDRYNAMKPGKVYHIRMQAICNIDPS
jgi:hypothetical protein